MEKGILNYFENVTMLINALIFLQYSTENFQNID